MPGPEGDPEGWTCDPITADAGARNQDEIKFSFSLQKFLA